MDVSRSLSIPGVEVLRFDSVHARGPIELSVSVQGDGGGAPLPVVYVTDANAWYAAVTQIVGVLQTYHELPGMCIVGVGYPIGNVFVDSAAYATFYARRQPDLSPVTDPDHSDADAHGPAFLRCLVDEVIPMIESRYDVDARNRVLLGDSIGGDFAIYAALARPGTFQGVVAGSPMLVRPRLHTELTTMATEVIATATEIRTGLFVAAGEMEADRPRDLDDALAFLRLLGPLGLRVRTEIFPGETHASVWPLTFSRGLRWLFEHSEPSA